jgi:hypothetical protein
MKKSRLVLSKKGVKTGKRILVMFKNALKTRKVHLGYV